MVDSTDRQAGRYKAYPEYKDSGVEWLGEIPSGWDTASLSKLFIIKAGGDLQESIYSEFKTHEHKYPIYTNANNDKTVYGYTKTANYPSNSITVSGRGEVGFAVFRNHEFDAIIRLLVLTPNYKEELDGRFFAYFINEVIDFKVQSSAIGQLSTLQISPYKVFIPPTEEQIKIANYLDHETAKIDTLIETQQRLIELLTEKRQAVISQAVTKGLNPDVPMKDSGVEWLGEVPAHWEVKSLKYVVRLRSVKAVSSATRYVGLENIESGTGKYLATEDHIPTGISNVFYKGDLLFGKLRPYLAKSWLATFSGICSSEFLVLESMLVHPKYLNYLTLSNRFIDEINSSTYGSKMPRASWDFISLMPVPAMGYDTSRDIAEFLDEELSKFDVIISKANQQIQLMQERRTALISAAVTGKIDVRDWEGIDPVKDKSNTREHS